MEVFIDIETDDLDATLIHCIQCYDLQSDKWYTFEQGDCYTKFPKFAEGVKTFIAHYGLGFDIPVLNRLTGTKILRSQVIDTVILSQLANPERKGMHSLKRWGDFLGFPKGDSPDDWKVYTPYMLEYCKRDVEVTVAVYQYLIENEKEFLPTQAVQMEHETFMNIKAMTEYGVGFDERKAIELLNETTDKAMKLEDHIKTTFDVHQKLSKRYIPKYKKDETIGAIRCKGLTDAQKSLIEYFKPDDYDENPDKYGIDVYEDIEFNLNSPKQIVTRLNAVGWKPYVRTDGYNKSMKRYERREITKAKWEEVKLLSWKICEDNLVTISDDAPPEYKLLAKWKMYSSRSSWVEKQCLAHVVDERIHGTVMALGAVTNRMTHQKPNLANISRISYKDKKILKKEAGRYGFECRELFCAKGDGYVMLGSDASGLELRMLAHYMEDEDFTKAVIAGESSKGTDVHTLNQKKAGLSDRDTAKTFIYAFLYGAGDAKIGSIVGKGAKAGKILKNRFLTETPKLAQLIKNTKKEARQKSIEALDGRRIHIRSQHAALNSLLQGAGAIVCKYWMNFIMRMVRKEGLDAKLVLTVHDELQFEVHKNDADRLGQICMDAMVYVGTYLEMNVPLAADYAIADNWSGTH